MNKKDSIEMIKKGLQELKNIALKFKTEVSLAEITTDDGSKLNLMGELEVGVEVSTLDADGNVIPVNDGDYKYEGKVITVLGGKIDKIEEIKAEEVIEEEMEAPVEEEVEAPVEEEVEAPVEEEVEVEEAPKEAPDMESRIKSLEEAIAKILSIMEGMMSKSQELETENVELEKKVQELSAEPGDISVTEKKAIVEMTDEARRVQRLKDLSNFVKKG